MSSSLSLEALVVASVVVVVAEVEWFVELSSLLVFVTSADSEVEAVVSSATTVRALLKTPNWLANKVATPSRRIFLPFFSCVSPSLKSFFIIREELCIFKRFQKYFSKKNTDPKDQCEILKLNRQCLIWFQNYFSESSVSHQSLILFGNNIYLFYTYRSYYWYY